MIRNVGIVVWALRNSDFWDPCPAVLPEVLTLAHARIHAVAGKTWRCTDCLAHFSVGA